MNICELFSLYKKERGFGPELIYFEGQGFATYHINEDECYIEDIYVIPEKRKSSIASEMANLITKKAKESGCTILTGSVCPSANGAETSRKVLLAYGFKKFKETDNLELYQKEI